MRFVFAKSGLPVRLLTAPLPSRTDCYLVSNSFSSCPLQFINTLSHLLLFVSAFPGKLIQLSNLKMSATDSSQPSLEKDGMETIKVAMESVRLFNLPFRNYAASTKELKRINVTHNLNDEKLKSRILRRLIALQKMLNQQVKILEVFRDQIRKLEKCEQVPISESESCVRAIGDVGIVATGIPK
jgi:hypothetical protein